MWHTNMTKKMTLIVTSLQNLDVEKSLETCRSFFLVFLWKYVKKQLLLMCKNEENSSVVWKTDNFLQKRNKHMNSIILSAFS